MDKVTAPVLTLVSVSAGGSLDASTTYYYTVIALSSTNDGYQYQGTNKCVVWSEPSNEITAVTTATNKTVNLSWTTPAELAGYPANSWGVFIFRSKTSGTFLKKIRYSTRAQYTHLPTTIILMLVLPKMIFILGWWRMDGRITL